MAAKTRRKAGTKARGGARSTGRPKKGKPRAFRLDAERLAEARRILGTPNDTATLDAALDLVVFRNELVTGIDRLAGKEIASPDEDRGGPLPWRK